MTTVMLFFIMPVGWILYRGTDAFNFVTQSAYTRLVTASFLDLFDTIVSRGQAHVGEGVPSWVGVSRLFWFALLYVLGGFLWLWNLVGFRHLAPMGVRLVAAYSGLVLVTLVTGLSLVGGAPELRRSLTFGAFLGVPFLLLALQRHKPRVARVGFVGIASVLFLLSLPSFLSNALGIATWTFYDSEYSAGQWVHSLYGTGKGLRLFTTQYGAMPVQFYVTDATYTPDRQVYAYVSLGEEGVWQSMEELLDKFDRFSESGNPGLYIYTLKTALYSADVFGVHPDHANWRQLTERISARYNRAYDNGPIEMYSSEILRQDRGQ